MRALLLLSLLVACVPEAAEGEGEDAAEGEGEDACVDGDVHGSSAGFSFDACLTVSDDGRELHLVAPDLDLRVSPFSGTLAPPQTLDETNSSCFGFYERDGARWSIATGALGGAPIGECNVRLDVVDDAPDARDGVGDGIAIPDGEPLGDGLFLDFRF